MKIPKSENRKPSHGEGVCRGKYLMKPMTVKLLDASRTYWLRLGVQDWGRVIGGEE